MVIALFEECYYRGIIIALSKAKTKETHGSLIYSLSLKENIGSKKDRHAGLSRSKSNKL